VTTTRLIKLKNLLFQTKDRDLRLQVNNFRLAQFFKGDKVLIGVVGSIPYIAPKVIEGHHGPKANIWSIDVILHILSYLFKANTLEEVYEEILEKNGQFDVPP